MMKQALYELPTKGSATMRTVGTTEPILKTEFAHVISTKSTDTTPMVIPGRNMVLALVNMQQNTEDACIVSKEFVEMGWLRGLGTYLPTYVDYPLPKDCGKVEPCDVLYELSWWEPAGHGLVLKTHVDKHGGMNAYVLMGNTKLEIGDKLATWYGPKFTGGALMSYKDMPELEDTGTGERFKPTIIISTKNLNRGIGGQVREMSAGVHQVLGQHIVVQVAAE